MIRTVITPQQQQISIDLPQNYIGKKVEIIAFTMDEASADIPTSDKTLTHLPSERSLGKDWPTQNEDTAWQDL